MESSKKTVVWFVNMRPQEIREVIKRGDKVINRESGNSMLPLIKSRQACELRPVDRPLVKGDIVYARVRGHYYTHLVSAVDSKGRAQISNNHGHVNGWTKDVIALVTPLE